MDVYFLEQFKRVRAHFFFVYEQAFFGVAAQPYVVADRALRHLVEFLVDHRDAVFQRVSGIGEVEGFAVEVEIPGILPVDAKKTFHQGGFTRSILAHQ